MLRTIWARIWHDQAPCIPEKRWSSWRPVIDLRAVVNIEDVHHAAALIDPVGAAIGAVPSVVISGERPGQRLADPVWVDRKRGITELQPGSGNGSREQRAIARRAAGWKRISYCCPGSLVTRR